jgi:para-aminobenzoate synthetase/4-amino-4-deoxychorismate lyase
MITARFDDLRPHRHRSFALSEPTEILVADRIDQVPEVLERCEQLVMVGHWVAGYVAYEAAPAFDTALAVRAAVPALPYAWFAVFSRRGPAPDPARLPYSLGRWEATIDAARHHQGVDSIRQHILQGDTYQVNHTFRMMAPFSGDAASLYADLSRSQSCGYGGFLDIGSHAIVSASPELFFEWRHDRITSKPMKGTTARGVDLASDEQSRQWLASSPKNRAENLMIVDMVRNDLGRIARVGSVQVPALFTTEKYDTVWQLTSTVTAEPRPGTTLVDVFGALFPSASITGAPKVATMRIIADLEADPRGVYCGTLGFGGPAPGGGAQWAFNVAIRTVTIDRRAGVASYGTGGGITYDSDPTNEYEEALLKAAVLARRSSDFRLLETLRWDPDAGFARLDRHLRRLLEAAWYFDVPIDPAEIRAALDRAVHENEPLRVRLLVARDGWVEVETSELKPVSGDLVRLAVDDRPIDPADPFIHHKTTNRRIYEEARGRHPDADDVVLWNPDKAVTETTIANLAANIDGTWATPPTSDGCLAGTLRAELIENGMLTERSISLSELESATEVACFNSLRGWQAARLV